MFSALHSVGWLYNCSWGTYWGHTCDWRTVANASDWLPRTPITTSQRNPKQYLFSKRVERLLHS